MVAQQVVTGAAPGAVASAVALQADLVTARAGEDPVATVGHPEEVGAPATAQRVGVVGEVGAEPPRPQVLQPVVTGAAEEEVRTAVAEQVVRTALAPERVRTRPAAGEVGARSAEEYVGPPAAVEPVTARAAEQRVDSRAPGGEVGARPAADLVVAAPGAQPVVTRAPEKPVVTSPPPDRVDVRGAADGVVVVVAADDRGPGGCGDPTARTAAVPMLATSLMAPTSALVRPSGRRPLQR